jgi:hypothetical protein
MICFDAFICEKTIISENTLVKKWNIGTKSESRETVRKGIWEENAIFR